MAMHDGLGNPVTCSSPAALRAYDRAVDAQLHAWPGVQEALDEALAEATDFALALALQALVYAGQGRGPEARAAAARALACAASGALSPREQTHVEALAAIAQGRPKEALAGIVAHARMHPTDLLAAAPAVGAYGLFAFSGRADHNQQRLAFLDELAAHHRAEPAWLLANRGWARIECGAVDEGLAMARAALEQRPDNGHNAHIVLHGLYEQNAPDRALAFFEAWMPRYPEHALMWGHLHWHAALAELALERVDAAVLRLCGPVMGYLPRGTPFMGLADAPSLLWHLTLRGRRGLPWAAALAHAQQHFPKGANVFGELHLAMLAAASGDRAALEGGAQRLQALAERGHEGAPVACDWALALSAWLAGDREAASAHLAACEREAPRLGGSHAQRAVLNATRTALDKEILPTA